MKKYNLFGEYYNGDAYGETHLDIVELALIILEIATQHRDVPNCDKVKVESLEIDPQEE